MEAGLMKEFPNNQKLARWMKIPLVELKLDY